MLTDMQVHIARDTRFNQSSWIENKLRDPERSLTNVKISVVALIG